jgi:hypothetical protein
LGINFVKEKHFKGELKSETKGRSSKKIFTNKKLGFGGKKFVSETKLFNSFSDLRK